MNIGLLLLTIAIGGIGGIIANKLKIPGGLLVGAIIGVAVFNILTGAAFMPKDSKTGIQIVAGAFIGCIMEKSDLVRLPKIIKPAVFMLIGLLILNLAAGFLIWRISPLDLLTSLMCVVPGGISDTPIIAADMGADGAKVAVMQIVRQILGIGVFPALIYYYDRKLKGGFAEGTGYVEKRKKSKTNSVSACIVTLLVAAVFGIIGKISGIPSGTFILAIASTLVLKLAFDFAYIPRWLKKIAQVLSGCYLGSTILLGDLIELKYLLVPLLIIVAGYGLNCIFTGMLIQKTCHFTRKESMLITTPAGASDMALISSDLGVENTDVIILQVVRAVIVMSIFPALMNGIAHMVG